LWSELGELLGKTLLPVDLGFIQMTVAVNDQKLRAAKIISELTFHCAPPKSNVAADYLVL
jgi:hypothetical protein